MKTIIFLLAVSQYTVAASCNIEEGYYLITKTEELKVKLKSCDPIPGWGQDRPHFATFDKTDLAKTERELLTKHRTLISSNCELLGTGDVEVINEPSPCLFHGVDDSIAKFTIKYKCHLF